MVAGIKRHPKDEIVDEHRHLLHLRSSGQLTLATDSGA
jgi:hypothetical protein